MMASTLRILCVVFLLASGFGCYSSPRPDLVRPGPHDYQRSNAARHDPYADQNAGPEAIGARPREFMDPMAEPRRNQPFTQQPRYSYP